MATASEYFYSNQHKALKLLRLPYSWIKYYFSSKDLSQRLVEISENSEMDFLKALIGGGNSKLYILLQDLSEHKIGVNEVILIPPNPLQVYSDELKKMIDIPIPSSHIGIEPIKCRLQSAKIRKGMVRLIRFKV